MRSFSYDLDIVCILRKPSASPALYNWQVYECRCMATVRMLSIVCRPASRNGWQRISNRDCDAASKLDRGPANGWAQTLEKFLLL